MFKSVILAFIILSNSAFATELKASQPLLSTQAEAFIANPKNLSKEHIELIYRNGDAYLNENGLPYNPQKAFTFFEFAAQHNHPRATLELGRMYEFWSMWHSVPKPGVLEQLSQTLSTWNKSWYLKKSFELYLKSAQLGDPEAMSEVGYSYYVGRGTPKNITEAYFWFARGSQYQHYLSDAYMMKIDKDLTRFQMQEIMDRINAINSK